MELIARVREGLTYEEKTVKDLCLEYGVDTELIMQGVLARLSYEDIAESWTTKFVGYRPDGTPMYDPLWKRKEPKTAN